MADVFYGYPAEVWETCYSSLGWLSSQLNTTDPVASTSALQSVYTTLQNGIQAVQASQCATAMQNEYLLLQEIQALPIGLGGVDLAVFNSRVAAVYSFYTAAASGAPAVNPLATTTLLANGSPAIAYGGWLEALMTAQYETPPIAFTTATLISAVESELAAWQNIAALIIQTQGSLLTQAYDAANRQAAVTSATLNVLNGLQSGPFSTAIASGALWNSIVATPQMLTLSAILTSSPNSTPNQQGGVIRYNLGNMANQVALLLATLQQGETGPPNLGQVLIGDTLMDVAARNLGDFEQWSQIAALNGLTQPWVASASGSGVATPGQQLLLPNPNGTNFTYGSPIGSYENDVLGVDYYFGPINFPMPTWTGDYQTIAGYNNLAMALGRRLQTALDSLIYHPSYGSRIPPEVGDIQTQYIAQQLSAYAESALTSDPRVAQVLSVTVTAPSGPNQQLQIIAIVQPIGNSSNQIQVSAGYSTPTIIGSSVPQYIAGTGTGLEFNNPANSQYVPVVIGF